MRILCLYLDSSGGEAREGRGSPTGYHGMCGLNQSIWEDLDFEILTCLTYHYCQDKSMAHNTVSY